MEQIRRYPYVLSIAMIAVVTAFCLVASPVLSPANLDVLYMLAVLVSALKWGERPAIFTAIVGATAFDFCFIPPRFSFAISDLAYVVTLFGFLVVAVVTSRLARQAEERALERVAREEAQREEAHLRSGEQHDVRAPAPQPLGPLRTVGKQP